MEGRIAKVEAHIDHISKDIGELKSDVRGIRDRMTILSDRLDSKFVWMLGIFGGGFLILLGVFWSGYTTVSNRIDTVSTRVDAVNERLHDVQLTLQAVADAVGAKKH